MTDGHRPDGAGGDPHDVATGRAGDDVEPSGADPVAADDRIAGTDAGGGAGAEPDEHELGLEEQPEADTRSREELVAELAEAEARRDEYLEDVRRARAEFENYRKRVMREGAAQRDAGRAEVAAALIEVLDDVDRTVDAAAASSDEQLATGVQLVAEKLTHALRGLGLERVDATGVAFDPARHEAVQHRPATEESDVPAVVEVLRPGYRMGDRLIRPAMVVVEG